MAVQREHPVANTPDQHRFDDWTDQLATDLAATLPTDDDRRRFYESLIRAGAWAIYQEQGFFEANDFVDAISSGLRAQWHEDNEARKQQKNT